MSAAPLPPLDLTFAPGGGGPSYASLNASFQPKFAPVMGFGSGGLSSGVIVGLVAAGAFILWQSR